MFRMNSTKLVPNKKPKIVDNYKKRNLNSTLSITIPFNVTLDTGLMQDTYSVDTMSLLAGSDTFNHFVKVFDQFKVQSVHLCIDLAAPSTCNYTMKALFSCPLYGINFATSGYSITLNGEPQATSADQFCTKLTQLLTNAGLINDQHQPVIEENEGVSLQRILLWLLCQGKMFAINNANVLNDGNAHEIFNQDTGTVAYQMIANEEPTISINCTTYQQIGAAGLRQIPKGFYNAPNFNDQVNMKPNIYETGFVESLGNYIHQSYMPGAPLHLSLDMIGTSATEKSLYFPTSVVENISALDSINMCGRFAPVCLVQNKIKNGKGRDVLVNGNAVENAYAMKYDNVSLDTTVTIQKYNLVFVITVGGQAYTVTIPVSYCPTYYDMGGNLRFNVASTYNCIGYLSNSNDEADATMDGINQEGFENWIYRDMPMSNVGYCLYQNDLEYIMGGGQLSIQCYIDVRFKDLRNVLTHTNVNYPYIQCVMYGHYTLNDTVFKYNNCNLISTVDFIYEANRIPLNTSIWAKPFITSCNEREEGKDWYSQIDVICRKVKGDQAFNIANVSQENMYLNNYNFKNRVLGGIIIPSDKNKIPKYCVFNTFAVQPNTDYTVNAVYGKAQAADDEFYVFTLVTHPFLYNNGTIEAPDIQVHEENVVRNSTCSVLDYDTVPGADGKVSGQTKWLIKNYDYVLELNLSRIRSIGYSDGGLNSIIEHHLEPELLKNGRGVVDMNNTQRNGVYVVRSFGGIVGAAPGSLSNQL